MRAKTLMNEASNNGIHGGVGDILISQNEQPSGKKPNAVGAVARSESHLGQNLAMEPDANRQ